MMIGIYSIVSPTGKVYIGQSIDIEHRWKQYFRGECKCQTRLYNSLMKHGTDNHEFKVLEECDIEKLNERERHWQDYFDATGKNGLNCMLTKTGDRSGKHSKETKKRISDTKNGCKHGQTSDETKIKIGDANRGNIMSDEQKLLLSIAHTGKKLSLEHCTNISLANKGRKLSTEHRYNLKGKKKTPRSPEHCAKLSAIWKYKRDNKLKI